MGEGRRETRTMQSLFFRCNRLLGSTLGEGGTERDHLVACEKRVSLDIRGCCD